MKKRLKMRIVASAIVCMTLTMTGLLFTSCLKEGDDTIVLPLPDGKIPHSVISEDLQDSLRNNGMMIYEGITPPNIEGVYLVSPLKLHYSSDDYMNRFYDLTMTFREQMQRGMIQYSERQRDTVEGASIKAQVIGHDSCFTMYCFQNVSNYSGATQLWKCKIATVVSGIITKGGIRNCQYSYIMLEREAINNEYLSQLADYETFRIFYDSDSLTTKIR